MRYFWTFLLICIIAFGIGFGHNHQRKEAQKTIDNLYEMFQNYYDEQAEELDQLRQKMEREKRALEFENLRLQNQNQQLQEELEDLKNSLEGIFIKQSRSHNLDPAFVWAVVEQESGGRAYVTNLNTNGTRDHGLMQMNDGGTAQWAWKNVFPEEPFSIDALYCPITNMKLGMWLLSYLNEKFDSYHAVLTAYNRGIGGLQQLIATRGTPRSKYSISVMSRISRME